MREIPAEQRLELEELLADLRHDLGKHARLPLALLRPDAMAGEVHAALAAGLLRTRRGREGTKSARQLWDAFCRATGRKLEALPGWSRLATAVARVLCWEEKVRGEPTDAPPLDRAAAEADLAELQAALRALEEELALER